MNTTWKWVVITCVSLLFAAVAMGDEEAKFEPSDQQILLHAEAQRHRVTHGRDAQELDAECCAIAQRWAEHMAARQWMGHGGGEQIVAYGYSTPAAAMRVWIASGGHNDWLLSSTRRAGWGAAQSSGGTWYWAGAFRGATTTPTSRATPATPASAGRSRSTARRTGAPCTGLHQVSHRRRHRQRPTVRTAAAGGGGWDGFSATERHVRERVGSGQPQANQQS